MLPRDLERAPVAGGGEKAGSGGTTDRQTLLAFYDFPVLSPGASAAGL
jgi:hypothetical protein